MKRFILGSSLKKSSYKQVTLQSTNHANSSMSAIFMRKKVKVSWKRIDQTYSRIKCVHNLPVVYHYCVEDSEYKYVVTNKLSIKEGY